MSHVEAGELQKSEFLCDRQAGARQHPTRVGLEHLHAAIGPLVAALAERGIARGMRFPHVNLRRVHDGVSGDVQPHGEIDVVGEVPGRQPANPTHGAHSEQRIVTDERHPSKSRPEAQENVERIDRLCQVLIERRLRGM